MERILTTQENWKERIDAILARLKSTPAGVDEAVREIIARIQAEGDNALFDYTRKFDRFDPQTSGLCFTQEDMEQAASRIPADLLEALETAAARIRAFHEHQKEESWITTAPDGTILGQKVSAVGRAGIYIPGGRNAFPSTMLMNVIPAQIAGVKEIIVVSPTPDGRASDALLAAGHIIGCQRIYRIGGAQAVAALAYGTQSIPRVDKVVGPGNMYVAHAKRILQGIIGIDSIAGPSEVAVIADKGANPHWAALDLLSQAEHDPMASAMLITPHAELADKMEACIAEEVKTLPRPDVIHASLTNHGACIITRDLDEAFEITNMIAPEHLELMLDRPFDYLGKVENAGAVFLGYNCMETIGDYIAGPNHTLPTGSTARFSSPLGVYDFLKRTSIVGVSAQAVAELGPMASRLARSEELEAHARAVDCRLS